MLVSEEEWRPVVGWEKRYEVSNLGRVRSVSRRTVNSAGRQYTLKGRLLKQQEARQGGYLMIGLWSAERFNTRPVHQLVLEAFCEEPRDGRETRHLDGNPKNNARDNLAWGTPQENTEDKIRHASTRYALKRGHCRNGHPWTNENMRFNSRGAIQCITCRRESDRRRYWKQRSTTKES